MKKKLLSLLTSLMLACSLAAFMPQQYSAAALESTQTQTVVQQNEHKVKGEVVAQESLITASERPAAIFLRIRASMLHRHHLSSRLQAANTATRSLASIQAGQRGSRSTMRSTTSV